MIRHSAWLPQLTAAVERKSRHIQMVDDRRPFPMTPGFLIGVAVAGFFDGIFLHQILQWHHMICIETHCVATTVATLKSQTFTDGIFHGVMWLVLLVGLGLLTAAINRREAFSSGRLWGSLLFGGGVFNVVEGIIDHHILQIHHVRFGPTQTIMDVTFLIASAALAVIGWLLARSPHAESDFG